MAKLDEAKPVLSGYDFGDEWLKDLDDALDFDASDDSTETSPLTKPDDAVDIHDNDMELIEVEFDETPVESCSDMDVVDLFDVFDENVIEEVPEIELDIQEDSIADSQKTAPDNDLPIINEIENLDETDSSEASDSSIEKGRSVTARTLNIATLQQEAEIRQKTTTGEHADDDPLKDPQLWQFVTLIAMRLFDDLELLIVQKHCDEAVDLLKQLNRLSNILAFAGLSEQLPLIAYIGNLLPVTFSDAEIGEQPERKFDPLKMRHFNEKSNEFLNCLVYLLTYISKQAVGFDTGRFTDSLEKLYSTLNMTPGQPSAEAPLAITDNVNPHELTTRTVNKLSRTLEALVTESLHYIESAVFYGYASGFNDAEKSLNNAGQIAREYHLTDFEDVFIRQCQILHHNDLPNTPGPEFYDAYREVCQLLESHFSKTISDKKIKHLRALIEKFKTPSEKHQQDPFCNRWEKFLKSALPVLDLEKVKRADLRENIQKISELAKENDIEWITETFDRLDSCWDTYTESSAEAFIMLADELRAFPTEDIEESDVEQLNHERLKVLFSKKLDAKPQTPYAVVKNALALSDILLQQMETPALISSARIQELLIDARQIHCHAITRTAEILLTLLERIPHNNEIAIAESVVNAIYFTAGFLQTVCTKLLHFLEHAPNAPAVSSCQLFYGALLSLYQTPGQPRDSVTWFIVKRLNTILSELQLVWVNTSTPTSTEYYCTLIRQLLQISTICELKDARNMLITHLNDIPAQDFINTENRTMNRQCARIIHAIEESCPKLSVLPSSNQVKLFFSKTIAALNQLLSSNDANDSRSLSAEISRIESRISILGMTTDFPPVIAFIYELHHFAYDDSVDRKQLEDLLYQMINVANNICPEWVQPKEAELEFVKSCVPIPMSFFQEMLESLSLIHEVLQIHAQEEPIAWEKIQTLNRTVRGFVNYAPNALQLIAQNAQNRCRYLKKNIFINVDTSGYPKESDLPSDSVRPVIAVAFATIVDNLVQTIIDNAFSATDFSSRISIVLHPFPNEFSVSIFHNGKMFTKEEMLDRLESVNIVPAQDDNLFDLLVGAQRLMISYPPTNSLAYILPLLRQFEGHFDVNRDKLGNTQFYISFKL